jgi:hypothetical protein
VRGEFEGSFEGAVSDCLVAERVACDRLRQEAWDSPAMFVTGQSR